MKKALHFAMLLHAAFFLWVMNPLSLRASCPVDCDPLPVVTGVTLQYAVLPDMEAWYIMPGDLQDGYHMCLEPGVEFYDISIDDIGSTVPLMPDQMNPFFLTGTYPQSFYDYWSAKGVNAMATDPSTWQYWMYRIILGQEPMFYAERVYGYYTTVDGLQYLASGGLVQKYLRISGDYPAGAYTFTGQIMDMNGCMTDNIVVSLQVENMVVESVSLESATDPAGPWTPVPGSLAGGYSLCLDPAMEFYYLNIDELISSMDAVVDVLNPFSLTGTYPQSFFDYWNLKGVNAGAAEPQWQYYMWRIINGWDPMFYIVNTAGGYRLIDGLQYVVSGGTLLNPLRVSGDYPGNTYTFSGELYNSAGCTTNTMVVSMTFHSEQVCLITGEDEACSQDNVTFTAPAGMAGYGWTISGNGTIASGANKRVVHIKAGRAGDFTLSLVITGENSYSSNCQKVVTIVPKPTNVSRISGVNSVCANATGVNYTVSIRDANEFNWEITPGGTIAGQVDDITVDPAVSTITVDFQGSRPDVTLSVTGINHQLILCEGKKQDQHVKVNPIPDKPVISASGKNLTSSAPNGNQWFISASSSTGPWTLIPGADKKKYTARVSGWYTVEVTNNSGCISEKASPVMVTVTKESPATDEAADATLVTVYPNPGNGHFTLKLTSSPGPCFNIRVYTSMGKRIMETVTPATGGIMNLDLDLSDQPDGVYSVVLKNDAEQIIKRVIVRK